jgi:hypothetical protein
MHVKEFYIMAVKFSQIDQLLGQKFTIENSKQLTGEILGLMGITKLNFIYTQNTISKITDTTKKSMFVDDERFIDYKAAYDITNSYYEVGNKQNQLILPRLFVIKSYSRSNVVWLNRISIDYEDAPIINRNYPIGIDFISFQDRFLVVVSNQGNLRILELNYGEELNSTQSEILSNWQNLFIQETNKGLLHSKLWDNLNLESVNKKFYAEIIQAFTKLHEYLFGNKIFDNNKSVIFTNRLIGRLLFCYFLKKKGVIPSEYFEINIKSDNEYYKNTLAKLFFAVLNTPINERNHDDMTTPYLNGGLFERKDTDIDIDDITFPSNYFKEIFAIFKKYNWTVDESLSNYEVVAIDPEMLGRIFENLLAQINENDGGTNESARKAKGAFYTPRIIVDYMCKESLRQYLKTNSADYYEKIIDRLIDDPIEYLADQKTNWNDDVKPFREHLKNILDKITIFDPACGSGAFPIGMMHLILKTYERCGDKMQPTMRKIEIVKNNIFGADIEPNAIEISRLRAWLSIIVDEDNNNIKPLPNLDFKFVCCNSLINLEKSGQTILGDDLGLADKLQELQKQYFNQNNSIHDKHAIRDKYIKFLHNTRQQFAEFGTSKLISQMASYHPFDNNNVCEFYDSEFMFGVNAGFDIVIGNPPYVGEKGHKEIFEKIKGNAWGKKHYKGKMDLFYFFFHLGIDVLKVNGTLTFITTNYFISDLTPKK